MAHPSVKDWESDPEVLAAGTRGFNMLTVLPKLLRKHYPWLEEFEIGFCDKDDIENWTQQAWRMLRTEHFEIDNFNQAIGLRFGLTDEGGNIRWRKNYLMFMPKDVRRRQEDIRSDITESTIASQIDGKKYVHPEDPRGHEFLQDEEHVYSTDEESRVRVEPTSNEPKRGRPRKT